ncbi:uncharacterized protein PGTG_10936 [Puccinia graminis f. sp. tritici CRL 75-36-700-3]|uniref:Uncharacterized protein n=1 Tax=Puccinia graminis f. sp. tritici (strain CRL 75-36-700-3 / race SCCL) TaxID=418459 RepID=E3KMX1_PUCGT|nr:uncharacterized protein PGTG_10936 [Puccinia graminis f. sp. tritici CRL 75-36-700-3]EFP85607.2 hypothetical protein PGTG_10936 [Puccinia graminis f. sp. tritici CRL 75-36-700-3]
MNPPSFTDNAPASGDCIVWTEEKPAITWESSLCQNGASPLDEKAKSQVLGYYSSLLSPIEEDLPPKYDSRDRRGQPHILHSLLHTIRFILLDHLVIKVLVVYLLMVYTAGNRSLLSPFAPSNWSNDEGLLRSHSRDFLTVDIYELYDDTDAWSRSILGRVGSDSPLLTYSEMELVGQVEWEVEPERNPDEEFVIETESAEEQVTPPPKVPKTLPLPFRRPSHVFNDLLRLYDQGNHGSTQSSDSRSPLHDTQE